MGTRDFIAELTGYLEQAKQATPEGSLYRRRVELIDASLELFFDPEGQGKIFYQFCINSLGAVYDARVDPYAIGATDTVTWDSGAMVRTSTGKDYWELRAAVPFAAFVKKPPEAGSTWRFNLGRNRFADPNQKPFSAWSPTFGGFRNLERFGVITFNAPKDRGRVLWSCDFNRRLRAKRQWPVGPA
jgi:hypothetical protein